MIRSLVFHDLPPRKVLQLLSVGMWSNARIGETLLERGKRPETISLIVEGNVRIERNGHALGELVAGNLVGSALLLTGVAADVDAVAVEPVRTYCWQIETLERYLVANPEVRIAVQRHLARDLAGKLVSYAGSEYR